MIACIDVLGGFVRRGSGCNSDWAADGDLAILIWCVVEKPQGKANICIDYSGVFSVMVTGRKMRLSMKSCAIVRSWYEILPVCLPVRFIYWQINPSTDTKYASQSIVCVPRYCDADKKEDNAAPIRSMLHVAIRVVLKEIPEIRMSKHQDCSKEKK